jgi:predicted RNA-binding Zn-ribbon protein involved in translation (DUF1610 family)
MEIIKRGEIPVHTYDVTCRHCKTEFRFQKDEAVYHCDPRDGDYLSIRCPVCRHVATKSVGNNGRMPDIYGYGSLDR